LKSVASPHALIPSGTSEVAGAQCHQLKNISIRERLRLRFPTRFR
jgi:hypothetical protein